jgi:glyoxylase-like metal-dependent hydrolase (beta-lactamase superfamily II)
VPQSDKADMVKIPMAAFLVQHPNGNVLVDTGPNPDVYCAPNSVWGALTKSFEPITHMEDDLPSQLKKIKLDPRDINYVVNTHLHFDHAGGNRIFKDSTFLVSVHELEWARRPENEGMGYFKADWNYPLNYQALDGPFDIFNDGLITIVPMPGHTPGHQIVMVRLKEKGVVILSGDSVPFRENYEMKIPSMNNTDNDLVEKSVEKLNRMVQEENATLIHGHDPFQWEKMKLCPDYYS